MSQRLATRWSRGKSAGARASSVAETPPLLVAGPGGEHADDAREPLPLAHDAEARGRRGGARLGDGLEDLREIHATGQAAPSFLE